MCHGLHKPNPHSSLTDTLTFRIAILVVAMFVGLISIAEKTNNIVPFKSPHRDMMVVDVRVNGKGPYPFLVDTGATSSVVDPNLSASLHLPPARSSQLASWEGSIDARRALVDSLSFGPINSGPLTVLVQPLTEFTIFDSGLRGVLGQDVLLCSNFLIDNRRHRIEFDNDAVLLAELSGERIAIAPVRTRSGELELRLISVAVRTDRKAEPLHLLLDSGADMLVLQPTFAPAPSVPRGTKWIADQSGKLSPAVTFHTHFSVGSEEFSAEAWIGDTGLKQFALDGLLPTGAFSQIYIANQGSFVIFEPRRTSHKRSQNSETARPGSSPGPDISAL